MNTEPLLNSIQTKTWKPEWATKLVITEKGKQLHKHLLVSSSTKDLICANSVHTKYYHVAAEGGENFIYFSDALNERFLTQSALISVDRFILTHYKHILLQLSEYETAFPSLNKVLNKKKLYNDNLSNWKSQNLILPVNFKEVSGPLPTSLLTFMQDHAKSFISYTGESVQSIQGDCGDISNNFFDGFFYLLTGNQIFGKAMKSECKDAFDLGKSVAKHILIQRSYKLIMEQEDYNTYISKDVHKNSTNYSKRLKIYLDKALKQYQDSVVTLIVQLVLKYTNEKGEDWLHGRINFEPIPPGEYFSRFLHKGEVTKKTKNKQGKVVSKTTVSSKPPLDPANFLGLGSSERKAIQDYHKKISESKSNLNKYLQEMYEKATMVDNKEGIRIDPVIRKGHLDSYIKLMKMCKTQISETNETLYNYRIKVGSIMKQRLVTLCRLQHTKKLDYKILNTWMKENVKSEILSDMSTLIVGKYIFCKSKGSDGYEVVMKASSKISLNIQQYWFEEHESDGEHNVILVKV